MRNKFQVRHGYMHITYNHAYININIVRKYVGGSNILNIVSWTFCDYYVFSFLTSLSLRRILFGKMFGG